MRISPARDPGQPLPAKPPFLLHPASSPSLGVLADSAETALRAFREALQAKDKTLPTAPEPMVARLKALEAELLSALLVRAMLKLGPGPTSLPQVRARLDAVDTIQKEDRKRRFGNYHELLRLVVVMAKALDLRVMLDGPASDPMRFLLVDLPSGQVSFGIKNPGPGPISALAVFEGLDIPETEGAWDKHTKDEKIARIRAAQPEDLIRHAGSHT